MFLVFQQWPAPPGMIFTSLPACESYFLDLCWEYHSVPLVNLPRSLAGDFS